MFDLDPELAKFVLSLGVGGVLATVMFYVYRKDAKGWGEQLRVLNERWQRQSELMTDVVIDNTKAITLNTELTRQVIHHIETTRLVRLELVGPHGEQANVDFSEGTIVRERNRT